MIKHIKKWSREAPWGFLILPICGLVFVLVTATVSGCSTVAGFGKDLSALGDKLTKKAEQK